MKNNIIDTGRNTVSKFLSYADDNRQKLTKVAVDFVLLIIIFAIFGCFDFLNMSFKFESLATAKFWTKVIAKAIAGAICAYNLGINFVWDRDIEKDQMLKENAQKYERLLKLKDDKTFNYFVLNVFNREEKIRAYISSINKQIYRLNLFSRKKDKLLFSSDNEEDNERKLNNKYCKKRQELENLKTKDYIDKNIDSIEVKYNVVDPQIFAMEIDGKPNYHGTKTKGNITAGKIRATTNGLMSMLLCTMFITIIGLDADQSQFESQMIAFWHYCLNIAEDVGIIAWQVMRGIWESPKLISQEITQPLVGRNRVLIEYVDWCAENKIENSKAHEIYKKLLELESSK